VLRKTFLVILLMAVAAAFLPVWGDPPATPRVRTAVVQEMTEMVSPGTVTCVGGQPSGSPNPFTPCSPGTRQILTRGEIDRGRYQVTKGPAELFAGVNEVVVNCDLDANMAGPCWGTFKWAVRSPFLGDPGEIWEGFWFGYFDLTSFIASYRATGYGHGGRLEGLQLELQCVYPGLPEVTGTFTAQVTDTKR
jgi:hypothetical protein